MPKMPEILENATCEVCKKKTRIFEYWYFIPVKTPLGKFLAGKRNGWRCQRCMSPLSSTALIKYMMSNC